MLTTGSSDLYKPLWARKDETEVFICRVVRVSPVTPFHQEAAVPVGEAGEQAGMLPTCSGSVQPSPGKNPPKSTAGRRKASFGGPRKVKFSSAFGRQPGAYPFRVPALWSTTPCGSPSCCSTYLTIINSPEAPTTCFVLDSMQLPQEQGIVWQLFLCW